MYQVISYERDRYDTSTLIRNHKRMGVKSFEVAMKWLGQHKFAELRKSTPSGFETVAMIKRGQIIHLK